MSKTYVIVGAGFRGFCDSKELLEKGHKVIIIDSAPFFGGISYSANIKGFAVDKGVHMFDSIPQALADNVEEIMEGNIRTIDFVSMSAFNGKKTDGFSLPDLNSLDDNSIKEKITQELLALDAHPAPIPTTLAELFEARYGKTAGGIFSDIFKSVYNLDAKLAQPDAISKTSLGRLKYLEDDAMLAMKAKSPWLDNMLAARRKKLGKVDDLVSVYPTTGEAMRGWCERAAKWLEKKGATILLGENISKIEESNGKIVVVTDKQRIDSDKVIWTNDNTQGLASAMGFSYDLKEYISGTPMLFATMMTHEKHIKDFTYLQNFDPQGFTYRTASAGIYSNQNKDGVSFITSECPTPIDSERWKNADKAHSDIWNECKALGIIAPDAELVDHSVIRLPSTFKVAKLGYDEKIAEFNAEVAKRNKRVIFRDVKPFFRREIYLDAKNIHDLVA